MALDGGAELFFILAMMLLIIVGSFAAVYIFIRTYKKEMREREARRLKKDADESDEGRA
jgi:hypothetical protein